MKRFAVIALCLAGLAISACAQRSGAQRSGAHGGASSHGGSFGTPTHGGFSPASSHGLSTAPHYSSSLPLNRSPGIRASNPYGHPGIAGNGHYRRPYTGGYRNRGPYLAPAWTGWSGFGYLGYPDTFADDGDTGYGDQAEGAYGPEPETGQQPDVAASYPQYPPQRPAYAAAPQLPAREPEPEEAVTLVFKDGRPAEQIHNYMLTRTTLYVRDQHHSEIPLAELDLAATKKANHDAGVDFELLPAATN
jgi:hypothetical protein